MSAVEDASVSETGSSPAIQLKLAAGLSVGQVSGILLRRRAQLPFWSGPPTKINTNKQLHRNCSGGVLCYVRMGYCPVGRVRVSQPKVRGHTGALGLAGVRVHILSSHAGCRRADHEFDALASKEDEGRAKLLASDQQGHANGQPKHQTAQDDSDTSVHKTYRGSQYSVLADMANSNFIRCAFFHRRALQQESGTLRAM